MCGVCAVQNNIDANKPQELRFHSCLSTPVLPPCTVPGVGLAFLEGSHCTQFGGPGGSKPLAPKEVPSSLVTKSHRLPPSGLRRSWSNPLPTAAPSEEGVWGQGVFGHFSLPEEGNRLVLYCWALVAAAGVALRALLHHPRVPAEPSRLLPAPWSLSPRLPRSVPMLHSRSHSWDMLCQLCKSTPQPLALLRGCGLAAPGWEMEGGGGEVDEGDGRLRFLPL